MVLTPVVLLLLLGGAATGLESILAMFGISPQYVDPWRSLGEFGLDGQE
jgi:hypothetical protein